MIKKVVCNYPEDWYLRMENHDLTPGFAYLMSEEDYLAADILKGRAYLVYCCSKVARRSW